MQRSGVLSMRASLPSRLTTMQATLRLLYRSNPQAFVVGAIASLTEPLFYPALLLLLQQLFTRLTGTMGNLQPTSDIIPVGLALLAILLVQRVGIIVRDGAATILRQEAWVVISKQIMQKLPTVPYSLFDDNAFQARYGLVIREASHRAITLVDAVLSTVPILLGLLGLILALFTIAPLMVIALLLIAIPAALIERRFSYAMYELQEHSAPMQLRMDALTNMQVDAPWQRDVRVYRSDLLGREHAALAETYLRELKQLTLRFFRLRTSAAIVQVLGLGLALLAAYGLLSQGQLSLANLAVLVPGVPLLSGMIGSFIYQLRSFLESLVYSQTLFDFLQTSFDPQTAPYVQSPAQTQPSTLTAVRLEDVSYTYPGHDTPALTGIACAFTPGLTAIVGSNGAGKSTLVKLVAGLLPTTTGKLYAVIENGEHVSLDECIKAVLFQDPGHFPFSIRHNVTMQFAQSSDEEYRIREVLQQAGLWETVQALPNGIDTVVGAGFGGVTDLSGGQWQRLALARLLYHNAPIIILDEPSASLDPAGERQIFALLSQLAREKIILFTTHRYDTIRQADRIVVLVDAQIAEIGTHEELEQKAGAFWSLYFGQVPHSSPVENSS